VPAQQQVGAQLWRAYSDGFGQSQGFAARAAHGGAAIRQHWAVKLPFFGESSGEAPGRVPFITNGDDNSMTVARRKRRGAAAVGAKPAGTKSLFLRDFGPQIRLNATAE
jgi:hypothetical protein